MKYYLEYNKLTKYFTGVMHIDMKPSITDKDKDFYELVYTSSLQDEALDLFKSYAKYHKLVDNSIILDRGYRDSELYKPLLSKMIGELYEYYETSRSRIMAVVKDKEGISHQQDISLKTMTLLNSTGLIFFMDIYSDHQLKLSVPWIFTDTSTITLSSLSDFMIFLPIWDSTSLAMKCHSETQSFMKNLSYDDLKSFDYNKYFDELFISLGGIIK